MSPRLSRERPGGGHETGRRPARYGYRDWGTNFVEQRADLPPDVTTTSTTTVNPTVAVEMLYRSVAFPSRFALPFFFVFVVLYLAVVATSAWATVETKTSVIERCFGAELRRPRSHVRVAPEAGGARTTVPSEPNIRAIAATSAAKKRLAFLAGRHSPEGGSMRPKLSLIRPNIKMPEPCCTDAQPCSQGAADQVWAEPSKYFRPHRLIVVVPAH